MENIFFFRCHPKVNTSLQITLASTTQISIIRTKNEHPSTANAPIFIIKSFSTLKKGDVCKKLELNTLQFDQAMRGLGFKDDISQQT